MVEQMRVCRTGGNKQLKAIVWDLGGTQVAKEPDHGRALNTILGQNGIAGLSLDTVRPLVGKGAKKLIERGFRTVGVRPGAAQLEKLFHQFIKVYTNCATDNSRPFPRIVETLQQIREMDVPMGVCTNKPEALSRQILEGLGLASFFSSVIGGDTTSTSKPDPQSLLRCLQELASEPSTSLMIGDSAVDVDAARAAGLRVCVVPWGYSPVSVASLGAYFILRDLANVPKVITWC